MFRTRFGKDIVAEFQPPLRAGKKQKVILLCDGMPSIPRKTGSGRISFPQGLLGDSPALPWHVGKRRQVSREISASGYSRCDRRAAEGIRDVAFGQRFTVAPDEIFVIGGSFGGAAAILASLDPRVKKVIANCPVVDWSILPKSEKAETSNPNYAAYIREAFGNAYKLSDRNWKKLSSGRFYNPTHHIEELTASKILMFHAKDDPYVPYASVKRFARRTGAKLKSFQRGGHLSTERTVQKHWSAIKKVL